MFVTQRGLLYAIPAGLLLLLHWRRKYYPGKGDEPVGGQRGLVPWWVEWSIYATMPLFHVHTFLALSAVLAFWLIIGTWEMRKQIAILLAAAFLPATGIVWMITDHFQAKSILAWAPGWLQSDPGFAVPSLDFWFVKIPSKLGFWIYNFGLMLPLMIALVGVIGWRMWKSLKAPANAGNPAPDSEPAPTQEASTSTSEKRALDPATLRAFAFVAPAAGIFLFALFVKTAPWGWDNTKLIIWAYFICLPFLWRELIAKLSHPRAHWRLLPPFRLRVRLSDQWTQGRFAGF